MANKKRREYLTNLTRSCLNNHNTMQADNTSFLSWGGSDPSKMHKKIQNVKFLTTTLMTESSLWKCDLPYLLTRKGRKCTQVQLTQPDHNWNSVMGGNSFFSFMHCFHFGFHFTNKLTKIVYLPPSENRQCTSDQHVWWAIYIAHGQ